MVRPNFPSQFCTACGTPLTAGYPFCGNCGKEGYANERSPSDSQTLFNQLIGTNGRINRAGYSVRSITTFVAACIAVALGMAAPFGILIGVVLSFSLLAITFCTLVRRFHDFNWGGASVLLLLIPFANIVIVFMLAFRSGTRGTNNHGHEPVDLEVGS